jgi:hypothetical protein
MAFDANAWAVQKSVACQHVKVMCAPCAMILAQTSYDEGQADATARLRAIITALRAERPSPTARLLLDVVLQALPTP